MCQELRAEGSLCTLLVAEEGAARDDDRGSSAHRVASGGLGQAAPERSLPGASGKAFSWLKANSHEPEKIQVPVT